jgi:hypothetical protein
VEALVLILVEIVLHGLQMVSAPIHSTPLPKESNTVLGVAIYVKLKKLIIIADHHFFYIYETLE